MQHNHQTLLKAGKTKEAIIETRVSTVMRRLMDKWKPYFRIQQNMILGTNKRIIDHDKIKKLCLDISKQFMIYKWKKMNKLELNVDYSPYIINESLKALSSTFSQRLSNLTYFKIEFRGCNKITGQAIALFTSKVFDKLKNVIKLDLTFYECKGLNNETFKTVGKKISLLKRLQNLSLSFSVCTQVTDEGFKGLLLSACRRLKYLQKLHLSLASCFQIKHQALEDLLLKISRYLNHLIELEISFHNHGFNFPNIDVGSFPKLKRLALDFAGGRAVNDSGLKDFGYGLMSSQNNLQDLSINLTACNGITDKGLEFLGLNKQTGLPSLKRLHMVFCNVFGLTDKGVKNLVWDIAKNFGNLQELSLSFDGCKDLTDKSLLYLGEAMAQLLTLRKMHLDFKEGSKFTEAGFLLLISKIEVTFTDLESLVLDFIRCHKISEEAKDQAKEKLVFVPNLEIL